MPDNRTRGRRSTRKAGSPDVDADQRPEFTEPKATTRSQSSPSSDDNQGHADGNKGNGRDGNRNGSSGRSNRGGNNKHGGGNGNKGRNNRGSNSKNDNGRSERGGSRNSNKNGKNNRPNKRGRDRNRGHNKNRSVVKSMQGADLTQRLPEPPKAPKDGLRIVALGGISEIGRNMTVFEYHNRLLIIDCGVLFPSSDEPGVDLILPDFSYLEDKMDRVEALVVTHGHEDHIGAIPWLLKLRSDIPIVASRFTCALIAAKCREHHQHPKLIEVNETSHEKYGPFDLRFWNVNHSIPDCLGIALKTGAGLLIHTGDIKLDQTPTGGRPTDLPALSRFGDEGVDIMLADSTNSATPGFSGSEADVAPTLKRLVAEAKQRVIIASFASNVYRVQAAVDAAVAAGRKVAFNGRSMIRNMQIAEEMGYLDVPRNTIVSMDDAAKMAPHKVLLVTTGTQGEPVAALSRMARREHRQITVRDGDLIVLSSSLVPGNEEAVFGVINMLSQIGAHVVTSKDAKVHTSGHGFAGELLFLYNAARPKNFMPVHGEWRHLRANKQLAISTGVREDHTVLAQNGVVVDLVDKHADVVGQIPVGNLYVDGVTMGDVNAEVLEDRAQMGEGGVISVTVVIDNRTGMALEKPRVVASGFSDESREMMHEVEDLVDNTLLDLSGEGENDPYRMAQQIKRRITKFVGEKWRRKPFVVPTVVPMTSDEPLVSDVTGTRESL